jgi:sugar lactone lactonase YvrE
VTESVVGTGGRRYRAVENWARLPVDWSWGDVAAVTVDAQDRVYVLNRGQYPMGPEHAIAVFEPDGTLVRTFGDGLFRFAHGIAVGPDGSVYTADAGNHVVRTFDPSGNLVQTIGTVDRPASTGYIGDDYRTIRPGGGPFNRPTRCAVGPSGDLFVSDGYGNARVHRFSPAGTLLASWGEPGDGPGQFNLVHSIWAHADGRLFVCDRENRRGRPRLRRGARRALRVRLVHAAPTRPASTGPCLDIGPGRQRARPARFRGAVRAGQLLLTARALR